MQDVWSREIPDMRHYARRNREGPCFICHLAAGDPERRALHEFIYEDDQVIVFLNRFPTLYGYTLIAPREHREHATTDFSEVEYLELQRLIYRVGKAIQAEVPTERLYILSLGSQQGNRHVHWHVAPLPAGVPYEEQQFHALMMERAGVLQIPREEMASLAQRIRARLLAA